MYSKRKFIRTLDQLTDIYMSGQRFGAHMAVPYNRIRKSVNNGEAVKLWMYERFDEKRLQSLREGLVFLSTPEMFNDPADSMPSFNLKDVRQRMELSITPAGIIHSFEKQIELASIKDPEAQKRMLEASLTNWQDNKQRVIQATEKELQERYRTFRHEIRCACFSENPCNPTMWAHYSDNWKGFAAGYEIDPSRIRCRCNTCEDGGAMPFTLAPILYEKRFDMSPLSAVLMDSCRIFPYPTFDTYLTLVHSTVHKDERWPGEKELRLFTGTCNHLEGNMFATLKPVEIILGPDVSQKNTETMKRLCESINVGLCEIIWDENTADYQYDIVKFGQQKQD